MEKEFVPYEQALALKELGFDEPCFGYYINESKLLMVTSEKDISYLTGTSNTTFISTPLYQQSFRWFREKHKLHSIIYIQDVELDWYYYDILEVREGRYNNDLHNDMNFKSYKESELECLKKLIEIVKSK